MRDTDTNKSDLRIATSVTRNQCARADLLLNFTCSDNNTNGVDRGIRPSLNVCYTIMGQPIRVEVHKGMLENICRMVRKEE